MIALCLDHLRTRPFREMRQALLALGLGIALPLTAAAQDVTGLRRTEATPEGYLEIRFAPCGAALCGVILRARDLQGREQPYAHVGKWMIRDMSPTSTGTWGNGRIWDPRNDRTFRSRMDLSGDRLSVSGCVLAICQSQIWQRMR